jgi:glucose/arabinose dehydrogenase
LAGQNYFTISIATPTENIKSDEIEPTINDTNLMVEPVFSGLRFPSSMVFLGPDDILVLEKNKGTVQRIVNGAMLEKPVFEANVSSELERGMLGIAVSNNDNSDDPSIVMKPTYVFLYYTQANGSDIEGNTNREDTVSNRMYRYELDNSSSRLINPELLLDLPALPSRRHNGGAIVLGPDGNVYVPIGDVNGYLHFSKDEIRYQNIETVAQNIKDGKDPDGRSGILRVTEKGEDVKSSGSVLGDENLLSLYYAYGIRNSFGLDFDPVTGELWDTENGPTFGDEINLVEPGFNSGWEKVQGLWHVKVLENQTNDGRRGDRFSGNNEELVNINGKGKYSPPEFTWDKSVGVTALQFLDSDKLGEEYENDLFVGDFNNGYLYHFNLNKDRNQLILDRSLEDKVADNAEELEGLIFARGFGSITDVEVSPYDGYIYVLSVPQGSSNCSDNEPNNGNCGAIFRIIPDADK